MEARLSHTVFHTTLAARSIELKVHNSRRLDGLWCWWQDFVVVTIASFAWLDGEFYFYERFQTIVIEDAVHSWVESLKADSLVLAVVLNVGELCVLREARVEDEGVMRSGWCETAVGFEDKDLSLFQLHHPHVMAQSFGERDRVVGGVGYYEQRT